MAKTVKTYAWNFRSIEDEGALVLRAISQDSIGVLKFAGGKLEFWHLGERVTRTDDLGVLFRAIERIEKST